MLQNTLLVSNLRVRNLVYGWRDRVLWLLNCKCAARLHTKREPEIALLTCIAQPSNAVYADLYDTAHVAMRAGPRGLVNLLASRVSREANWASFPRRATLCKKYNNLIVNQDTASVWDVAKDHSPLSLRGVTAAPTRQPSTAVNPLRVNHEQTTDKSRASYLFRYVHMTLT